MAPFVLLALFIVFFFFWELHFLISWNLPGPAGKRHHFTHTADFLFYLWMAKSIPVSCPAAAPLIPAQRETPSVRLTSKLAVLNQSDFRRWNEGVKAFLLCLSETGFWRIKRKRDLKVGFFFLPSILTHLIEISCPIFPEIWKPAPLQAVFPQGPTWGKLLSAFICFL